MEQNIKDYDNNSYTKFMKKAELDKAFHTLEGILTGIGIDNKINDKEIQSLMSWCSSYELYSKIHIIQQITTMIKDFLSDGILDENEKQDILWLCKNFRTENDYFDIITTEIQKLQGILTGIMADGIITDEEICKLSEWIGDNEQLCGTYPYDEINGLLTSILIDGKIDSGEKAMLQVFFSEFIDTNSLANFDEDKLNDMKKEITIGGICSVSPNIIVKGSTFCFTGASSKTTRSKLKDLILSLGGIFKNNVTLGTNYLIIGDDGNKCWAFSCYGRKVEQAINMRKDGKKIIIVHENDFWNTIENIQ
ncbi:BRCT domain-containing protein [Clostridium tyrobutyricum]|uniref:BRCT domain-containing protein n=1 Tax=Clostridium tyrobutyricum TaxID=1519 RepID=UPI00057CB455|nr:BRCT domain-containing protein [Clostridium tyrobutyricum]